MLNLIEFEPGSTVPLHSHPHEQLGIVLRGMQALVVDGTGGRRTAGAPGPGAGGGGRGEPGGGAGGGADRTAARGGGRTPHKPPARPSTPLNAAKENAPVGPRQRLAPLLARFLAVPAP